MMAERRSPLIDCPIKIDQPRNYIHADNRMWTQNGYICIFVHTQMYIHIYICTRIYAYVYTHVYTYIHAYTHTYTHMYMHIHTHVYVCLCNHNSQRKRVYWEFVGALEELKGEKGRGKLCNSISTKNIFKKAQRRLGIGTAVTVFFKPEDSEGIG